MRLHAAQGMDVCAGTGASMVGACGHLPGGHVGAVVSKEAKQELWRTLLDWWREARGAEFRGEAV